MIYRPHYSATTAHSTDAVVAAMCYDFRPMRSVRRSDDVMTVMSRFVRLEPNVRPDGGSTRHDLSVLHFLTASAEVFATGSVRV